MRTSGVFWAGVTAVMLVGTGVTVAHAVAGSTPTGPAAAATVKISVGEQRACSGALVGPRWVVTATSCFAEAPGAAVVTGTPAVPVTATVGRVDLTSTAGHAVAVDLVVPHPARDVALVRLASAVDDVAPVRVATTAPVAGERLTVTGYGRTSDRWVPDTAHSAAYEVDAVAAGTIGIQAVDDGATICKGDAGGPALRATADGALELVAIHHTAAQGGCLGQTATGQGATESRVDDLGVWIRQTTAPPPVGPPLASVAAGDWDGDGRADLVGADTAGDLWGHPHEGDALSPRFPLGRGGWSELRHLMTADFDGDGRADVLGVDAAGALWYYPQKDGALPARVLLGRGGWSEFRHVVAVDWDDDGKADVLGVDADGNFWLYVNRDLALPARVQLGSGGWASFRQVTSGDVDGDGRADVVAVDDRGDLWSYAHGPTLSTRTQLGRGGWGAFAEVMASDWDGDGRADVLAAEPGGRVWLYPNVAGSLPTRTEIGGSPRMR